MRVASIIMICCVALHVSSCKKEECPEEEPVAVDGRDQFVGQYKVYDTTGIFLYDMEIMRASDVGQDSLFVTNWGDRFDFYVRHENGDLTSGFGIIPPFPSFDHSGNRWALSHDADPAFQSGYLVNDTLRMSYEINNIAFYAEDGVPFFTWSYREYGVKQ